jgi:hypothetical protein
MNKRLYLRSCSVTTCKLFTEITAILAVTTALLASFSAKADTLVVTNMWSIATTEARNYVTAATTGLERGVAYNPLLGFAYIVSRNVSPLKIARVSAATGADLGSLDITGISGGQFVLSQIGVADDGAIYAANLTVGSAGTTASGPFRLYRWADDGSAPVPIFIGNPMVNSGNTSVRIGDAFDIRGSGINTEIIAAANATNVAFIFRPTDGTLNTFTQSVIVVTGAGLTDFAKGLSFGPTNTFFGKTTASGTLRLSSYNYVAGTNGSGASLRTYSILNSVCAIDYDPVHNLVGGVQTANATQPHSVVLYDISSGTATLIYTNSFPAPGTAEANVVGGINILSNRMISVAAANGVQMTQVELLNIAVPPTFSASPSAVTIVEGGYGSFSAAASGSQPITYQWYKNGTAITNETNTTLYLTNLTLADGGQYYAQAINFVGSSYSSTGIVTISSAVLSGVATPIWRVPGVTNHPWLANDNNSRGFAYNPANNTLIVCSRTGGDALYVLDAETGMFLRQMSFNGSGGTFAINMVACADDGRVFACNLTTASATVAFKIYMWPSDAAGVNPTVIYSGDPSPGVASSRYGDSFDVQGGGLSNPDLRIIAGERDRPLAFLIRDAGFGSYNDVLLINTPAANPGCLSVSLAEENAFWMKRNGTTNYFTRIAYDPTTGAGTVTKLITNNTISVAGYSVENQWLAGISLETPDNIRLYDVAGPIAVALDTDHFPADNLNGNGTGCLKFGGGRLFALDSNCGLMALRLAPTLRYSKSENTLTLLWSGNYTLQASGTINTGYTNVTSTSGYSVDMSTTSTTFFRLSQ